MTGVQTCALPIYEEIGAAQGAYDVQQAIVEKTKTALAEKPAGVIAARKELTLTAESIKNSGSALLYSGGDLSFLRQTKS